MTTEEGDAPIAEQPFLGGVTVVDFGEYRIARGLSRRHYSSCPHKNMNYDNRERRIWCKDCERNVEPFDAFEKLVEHYDAAWKRIEDRQNMLDHVERFKIRSLAAKELERVWGSRDRLPCCPCCKEGLFPEDFKRVTAFVSREFAAKRRDKREGRNHD